jgi:hypothetical protein
MPDLSECAPRERPSMSFLVVVKLGEWDAPECREAVVAAGWLQSAAAAQRGAPRAPVRLRRSLGRRSTRLHGPSDVA